jgi:HSP20 family molecular chaperone IbpA
MERSYGSFQRSLNVSHEHATTKSRPNLKTVCLKVTLPKPVEAAGAQLKLDIKKA